MCKKPDYEHVVNFVGRELAAIDRYERRALSRRRFAVRKFVALSRPRNEKMQIWI
jgi:hypothetical protein